VNSKEENFCSNYVTEFGLYNGGVIVLQKNLLSAQLRLIFVLSTLNFLSVFDLLFEVLDILR
jgi:hypothetical protein